MSERKRSFFRQALPRASVLVLALVLALILALALPLLLWQIPAAAATEYIVVVHPKNPLQRLSAEEARNIFLGRQRRWPDNSEITLVMNTGPEIHEAFTRGLLRKSPDQLAAYWKKILYSGGGPYPLATQGDEATKAYVGLHKNAIGYISGDALDRQVKKMRIH